MDDDKRVTEKKTVSITGAAYIEGE